MDSGSPYDLICLDIMMPGTDGHEALRSIRELEEKRGICGSSGVKVIMTTAMKTPAHCLQAFREGCESYLTKPIEEERLLAEVRSLLAELPSCPPPAASVAAANSPSNGPAAGEGASPRPGRYLIVDDDRVCRELLKDMLSAHGQCDFAYDGREAIDAVRLAIEDGAPYDLVCLDIMMPGTDGHRALREIREIEAQNDIVGYDGVKIIMTTALRNSKHCVQAFREGCESYVTKPVREAELLGAMRQLGVL